MKRIATCRPPPLAAACLIAIATAVALGAEGVTVLGSKTGDENVLTLSKDIRIMNPPSAVASERPSLEAFNKIYADFFGPDLVDLKREDGLAKLAELYAPETSNALYAKLKPREKQHGGSIYVDAYQAKGDQKILVFARIAYLERKKKILRSECIFINFTGKGAFRGVERGISTRQEMPKP